MASETGRILIYFSREFILILDDEDDADEGENERRLLQAVKETYTDDEKAKIAKLIKIELVTGNESEDRAAIMSVEVVEATAKMLEFQIQYTNPLAISLDPSDQDSLEISFTGSLFKDPLSEMEINSGDPLIVKLPRQIDQGQAEQIVSAMQSA